MNTLKLILGWRKIDKIYLDGKLFRIWGFSDLFTYKDGKIYYYHFGSKAWRLHTLNLILGISYFWISYNKKIDLLNSPYHEINDFHYFYEKKPYSGILKYISFDIIHF